MIPRVGEPLVPNVKYTLRPGGYVILPRKGSVLLTVQHAEVPDIQLPGGGIDPGESPLPALYREVLEETGWTIGKPRRFGVFRRFVFMPEYDLWAEKLCTIYIAKPGRRVHEPTEADHSALWLSYAQAIDRLGNDGDRTQLVRFASRYQDWY